jgi:hypothetical protein
MLQELQKRSSGTHEVSSRRNAGLQDGNHKKDRCEFSYVLEAFVLALESQMRPFFSPIYRIVLEKRVDIVLYLRTVLCRAPFSTSATLIYANAE